MIRVPAQRGPFLCTFVSLRAAKMTTVKGFWQHTNGKIYAVESTSFGKIVGGAGPLDPNDLRDLDEYDYGPAIKEWLQEALAQHELRRLDPTRCH